MADTNIRAVITAEDRASSVISGVNGSFTKMAGAVATGMAVFETLKEVTFGVVGVFTSSIEAFEKQQLATTRLQAGIKNVTSATDKNIDSLLKQASALEKVTRFSDEQIISAQGVLSTFQLNQSVIAKLTPRLLDMSEGIARINGGLPDLEGNAILVAKALGGEDIVGLVGALRRVGVIMTQHQEQILQTGNMEQRLATITSVLDQNFKGLGEAAGETAAGKMAQLQNAINNLQEQLGAALFDALRPWIIELTTWAQSDQARAVMQQIAEKVALLITKFGEFLKDNWPQIKDALISMGRLAMDIAGAIEWIYRALDALKAFKWLDLKTAMLGPFAALEKTLEYIGSLLDSIGRRTAAAARGGNPADRSTANNIVGQFLPHFAEGGIVPGPIGAPTLAVVHGGETVTPANQSPGQIVNVTFNGVFTGSQQEFRKLAIQVFRAGKDAAGAKSMSLGEMFS